MLHMMLPDTLFTLSKFHKSQIFIFSPQPESSSDKSRINQISTPMTFATRLLLEVYKKVVIQPAKQKTIRDTNSILHATESKRVRYWFLRLFPSIEGAPANKNKLHRLMSNSAVNSLLLKLRSTSFYFRTKRSRISAKAENQPSIKYLFIPRKCKKIHFSLFISCRKEMMRRWRAFSHPVADSRREHETENF